MRATILFLIFFSCTFGVPAGASEDPALADLKALVGSEQAVWLLDTIDQVQPPERLAELTGWAAWQRERGGGFYGILPPPLEGADLPIPLDATSRMQAALVLAQARLEAHTTIASKTPYPFEISGGDIPVAANSGPGAIALDFSALSGFFVALADGEISTTEAEALAALASNTEMLRHRRDLGYVPPPLPTAVSLSEMIERAGSPDPLSHLWCWISPFNLFGYADLAANRGEWSLLVQRLRSQGAELENTVLARIGPFLPDGFEVEDNFALTVGCLIRGWATKNMAGLNLEQVKDDWPTLTQTMTEEVFHRVQLRLAPAIDGEAASSFEDLELRFGDEGLDALYRASLYIALEGSANVVAGPSEGVDDPDQAKVGAALFERFIAEVVEGGKTDVEDEIITEGLRGNGPWYSLGYSLTKAITREEGPQAVSHYLELGPTALLIRGAQIQKENGGSLLGDSVLAQLRRLENVRDSVLF